MKQVANLTGRRFGRLVVFELVPRKMGSGNAWWFCRCDCNKTTAVNGSKLTNGETKSCGCLKKESVRTQSTTHGASSEHRSLKEKALYSTWSAMRRRCFNSRVDNFSHYGG